MKECTETDKPLVSIVMATYNPRMDWLKEQLVSLNDQSFDSLELLIIDDCSTDVSIEDIQECVRECITRIPFRIFQNEENLGSTKTFEKLTMLAGGEYIAYCDQDDVWHEDKISVLLEFFAKRSVSIAYSDVEVIDEKGLIRTNSIESFRHRHILYEGFGLAKRLVVQNFVIGCTMLIKSDIAKQVIPFISSTVHDHYLALMASIDGEFALCKKPLVSYRIHRNNQTNTLASVRNKNDYYYYKIKRFSERLEQLETKNISERIPEFSSMKKWAKAREAYYKKGFFSAVIIWTYRRFDPSVSLFEILALKMPDGIFNCAIERLKKEGN